MYLLKNPLLFVFLVAFSLSSQVTAVTIDFETSPSGPINTWDVVSDQYNSLGVHFSAYENGSLVDTQVLPGSWTMFSSNAWFNTTDSLSYAADRLTITFDDLVENVQWYTSTEGATSPSGLRFVAYDQFGIELEVLSLLSSGTGALLTEFSVSGIASIDMFQYNDDWFWGVDDLSFEFVSDSQPPKSGEVSLPSTFALLGLGALGFVFGYLRRY